MEVCLSHFGTVPNATVYEVSLEQELKFDNSGWKMWHFCIGTTVNETRQLILRTLIRHEFRGLTQLNHRTLICYCHLFGEKILLVICLFCDCLIVFVFLFIWCWGLDVDLMYQFLSSLIYFDINGREFQVHKLYSPYSKRTKCINNRYE